jgi:hypothetical protein
MCSILDIWGPNFGLKNYENVCFHDEYNMYSPWPLKGVYDSDLIKALEVLKMLQIDTGW